MRDQLILLEAIRLEIRAATEDIASAIAETPAGFDKANLLRQRADKLAKIAFDNTNLANDEKEALGLDE